MIYFFIALIACIIGSFIGVGGGIIIIPLLLSLGIEKSNAAVNSALTVFIMSILTTIIYIRRKQGDLKTAILFGIGVIPGAAIGVHINKLVSPKTFNIIFIVLMISLIIILFFKKRVPKINLNNITKPFIGLFIGIVSGLFGIGGGPITVPALLLLYGATQKNAGATAIYLTLIATGNAVLNYMISGNKDLTLSLYMIPAAIIGSALGTYFNKKASEKLCNILFNCVLIFIIIKQVFAIF
ncbi:sulfite exporter TauE/SafE family protein [Clostridium fallax]|uniref:Probable membrane transporter protein n=1 Tax=Clostridium fallax TaxID=1533 RepID=A0A1M4Z4Y0_9CLOT|nr:sulfite exporter TauE/SafE family protein [Clostridium fallax]SHF13143.1 hypothetical protein SAMN05443638_13710 [Clostridium fallax]SQB05892.1 putative permease [Clostridium fallax]